VKTAGKENLQTKTYKQNYKYRNRLESGKKVVGPISAWTLVNWWLGECGNKFIGVCTEANSVKGAEAAELRFQCVSSVRFCGLVVRVPGYRSRGQGSIPGITRFSEK
jgi:hypothetical protein